MIKGPFSRRISLGTNGYYVWREYKLCSISIILLITGCILRRLQRSITYNIINRATKQRLVLMDPTWHALLS
jgi:heme exporter protein D